MPEQDFPGFPGNQESFRKIGEISWSSDSRTIPHPYHLYTDMATTPIERFAYMQAQRYWVERSFQDAKSELGM